MVYLNTLYKFNFSPVYTSCQESFEESKMMEGRKDED